MNAELSPFQTGEKCMASQLLRNFDQANIKVSLN